MLHAVKENGIEMSIIVCTFSKPQNDEIKEDEVGRECKRPEMHTRFWPINLKRRELLEDVGVYMEE